MWKMLSWIRCTSLSLNGQMEEKESARILIRAQETSTIGGLSHVGLISSYIYKVRREREGGRVSSYMSSTLIEYKKGWAAVIHGGFL